VTPLNVNELLRLVQEERAVGVEPLYAAGIVNGQPVRFAVVALASGAGNELELVLDCRSWEGFRT